MRKMLLVLCCALVLAACGDRARKTYETAQFEEKQYNIEHASQLYREILSKYPDSPYADQARQRLAALEEKR